MPISISLFFFSSRRRHTRLQGDWSSDVCSSDLAPHRLSLRHSGNRWGAALLHEQLRLVYDTAKQVKPDALVVTHTPNPAFLDVTDMIRLNDVLHDHSAEPGYVARHMSYRAGVVRSVVPELGVDT